MQVDVTAFSIPAKSILIRGYPGDISVSMTLRNSDTRLNVEPVSPPSANIRVTLQISSNKMDTHRDKRSTLSPPVVVTLDGNASYVGLGNGTSTTITGTVSITLSRGLCDYANYICALVAPAVGASYKLADGTSHIHCVDIIAHKNCLGKSKSYTSWYF